MQGRHPECRIILSEEEFKQLNRIVRSKKTEFRLVQRAKVILLTSENKYRNTEIGNKVGCSRETVRHWTKCFQKSRMEGLRDAKRSGCPPKFTAKERTEVLAMATRSPESEGKYFTDWSVRELSKYVIKKRIVKNIHWNTVWSWLNKSDIKPHKWEYWLNSTDPDFGKKNAGVR